MPHIAIIYHTMEGQSEKIAHRIAEIVRHDGAAAEVFPVDEAPDSLAGFDAAILGGSIHIGRHGKELAEYATRHAAELQAMPAAFFSVSLAIASEHEKDHLAVHNIVTRFLDETGWHPEAVGMFGGAVAYTKYGFIKRRLMRHITAKEGGPTDTSRDHDLTDWGEVADFAHDVARHLVPAAG